MLKPLLASLTAKIMAGTFAATAATGGLAAAGALPQPAQQAISKAADKVGISVPSPEDSPKSDLDDTETARKPKAPKSKAPETETDVNSSSGQTNHGHCVSYAAKLGLKGKVLSLIAHDEAAIRAKVEGSNKADSGCLAAIERAKAAVYEMTRPENGSPEGDKDGTGQPKPDRPGHKTGEVPTKGNEHKPDQHPGDDKAGQGADGAKGPGLGEKPGRDEHGNSGRMTDEERPSSSTDHSER